MSRTFFALDRKWRNFSLISSPCPLCEVFGFVFSPSGLASGLALFHPSSIFVWWRRRRSASETGKRGGCMLATMDLSEARGLLLFRVVREGIGISQRLSAIALI